MLRIIRFILAITFLCIFGLFVFSALNDLFSENRPNPLTIPTTCYGSGLAAGSCVATMLGKVLVYIIPLALGLLLLPKSKTRSETEETVLSDK